MQNWPEGISAVSFSDETPPETQTGVIADWERLARSLRVKSVSPRPRRNDGRSSDQPKYVGIRPATEIARLSPEVLHAAWEHGLVTKHERRHGHRMLPAFDKAELETLGEAWRRRIDADAAGAEMHIPRYGVEQLATLGCLKVDAPGLPGTGPHFTPESIATFVAELESRTSPTEEGVPLRQALRVSGGGPKPWGPLFRAMLDKKLTFDLVGNGPLAERVLLSPDSVRMVATMKFEPIEVPSFGFSDRIVQRAALEMLNATHGAVDVLSGLPSTGTNPIHYKISDVVALAAEVVTLAEIAARLGVDPATAWQSMRRFDLLTAVDDRGVWTRSILVDPRLLALKSTIRGTLTPQTRVEAAPLPT